MASSPEELGYHETLRSVSEQNRTLEGIRSSAGILLAANSLGTSFFGNLTLHVPRPGFGQGLVILSFVLSAGFCVSILWPQRGWYSQFSASRFFDGLASRPVRPTSEDVQRLLALYLEGHVYKNTAVLDTLFLRFRTAAVLLIVEVLGWILAVGGSHA